MAEIKDGAPGELEWQASEAARLGCEGGDASTFLGVEPIGGAS